MFWCKIVAFQILFFCIYEILFKKHIFLKAASLPTSRMFLFFFRMLKFAAIFEHEYLKTY